MIFRKKPNFISFSVAATVTVLMPVERQICFTHGFQSALDVSARIKPTIHNIQGMRARIIPIRSSPLLLSSTNNAYGKGADIWPESNNDAVQLSDSFPNGIVPFTAAAAIEQSDEAVKNTERRPRKYIQRILKKAASKDESDTETGLAGKIPVFVALLLLVRGMARPADVALVACWTAYFTILNMTAQSLRDSGAPILPAVPPQGHVPSIFSHPMGMSLERSSLYGSWLKLGALIGLFGPLVWLLSATPLRGAASSELEAARLVGRPLFLLCCQMATERIAKRNQVGTSVSSKVRGQKCFCGLKSMART